MVVRPETYSDLEDAEHRTMIEALLNSAFLPCVTIVYLGIAYTFGEKWLPVHSWDVDRVLYYLVSFVLPLGLLLLYFLVCVDSILNTVVGEKGLKVRLRRAAIVLLMVEISEKERR